MNNTNLMKQQGNLESFKNDSLTFSEGNNIFSIHTKDVISIKYTKGNIAYILGKRLALFGISTVVTSITFMIVSSKVDSPILIVAGTGVLLTTLGGLLATISNSYDIQDEYNIVPVFSK